MNTVGSMSYLEMRNISKYFGEVVANDKINLSVERGEIHALLGENGAGKSTIMNVLYGMYDNFEGEIFIEGKKVRIRKPNDAIALGIGMVHQHFMLVPAHTVLENVILGIRDTKLTLNLRAATRKLKDLAERMEIDVDPNAKVRDLTVGQRQRVEILKALYRDVKILILDEPTAILTPQEADKLFQMMRRLTEEDITVIFISHKLIEIMKVCDRCTILRQGKKVATVNIPEVTDMNELAYLMVNRELEMSLSKEKRVPGDRVLEVNKLNYKDALGIELLTDVALEVRSGEILGVCGVDGNGQSELVKCITGLESDYQGRIQINGLDCKDLSVKDRLNKGLSHIPEDRHRMAIVEPMSVNENLMLMSVRDPRYSRRGLLNRKWIRGHNQKLCERYNVVTPSIDERIGNLSGGNQQKVVVGREMDRDPKLLIAVHPARGLDIAATKYIQQKMLDARDGGCAVLLVSTEMEEILELSDRILVIHKGCVMATLSQEEASPDKLGVLMAGGQLTANG